MEKFYFDKTSELKREFQNLQKKLSVVMNLKGGELTIEGEAINEFSASQVLNAMAFGFSAKKSLLLLDPDMSYRRLNIKNFTRRKDLEDVRSRIIGHEGKTKHTLENVSSCFIELKGNEVAIIGPTESIDSTVLAMKNIIKGSKQANVYNYLERMNVVRRKLINETPDLGLKESGKKENIIKESDYESEEEYQKDEEE